MFTAREVFQVIFWREVVDVRDKYGLEVDGGYGQAKDVFDANPEWLDDKVNFIQASDTGRILIVLR